MNRALRRYRDRVARVRAVRTLYVFRGPRSYAMSRPWRAINRMGAYLYSEPGWHTHLYVIVPARRASSALLHELERVCDPQRASSGLTTVNLTITNGDRMKRRTGKRVEFASTEGIQQMRPIADEFMRSIFGLEPGDYLITDESSLSDFRGDGRTQEIVIKVMRTYHLGLVPNNLLQLFREIAAQTAHTVQ